MNDHSDDMAGIDVSAGPTGTTISLTGEVDLANVDSVASRLATELRPPKVTLNLRGIRYLDSSGIRMLIDVAQLGEAQRIDLELVVAPDSMVAKVLALSQLERIYAIRATAPRRQTPSVTRRSGCTFESESK